MSGYFGQKGVPDDKSAFNAIDFHIRQTLLWARTATPVLVKAVHGGGIGAPPTVDVLPLVNMIDGVGQQTPHGIVYGIPAVRLQGGRNAVIIDPAAGDVGLLVVSDRDISAVKANAGAQSNPGSFDHHSLADGIYVGGILNPGAPNQYVQFTSDGIALVDKHSNTIVTDASGITINGVLFDRSGNVSASGDVTAGSGGADSVGLQTHEHPTAGNGPPSPPTPGS
jgi:hypothetical protein